MTRITSGESLNLRTFLCLESRHNSALLCLSEEQGKSALGSPANRRNSVENTVELGQEYIFACLLPQQLHALCIESPLLRVSESAGQRGSTEECGFP